ncbi:16S rRNA (guanine(966)-N(2))-methyltransferase RsmD [Caminicella sporogenes DSM 14501]|uniref:16S rRNA (Guanine(966)-N(2))-methyltransferase RsmD n=1 Tax=Caminicella sporogenes DSM 14501 TaxID=1121266 RepID=A0A1M6LGJ0_9FIRM|nr:16S rRNA (guanine(966)-N(2))-methyltransferase RsmD [Caminicella sporogenes]WIF94599.1 16S rRNA (guanine(966)-N(2))-methyltransferase RsmD [Caminicella sporogenes]SHJ70333.1 16S rRNA (guanine(966)-N(2))-methyltransferase RsmD [Caminicella sporogenes DSM 14501]
MRVIAGQAKGTKLKTLKGLDTRPTSDRVKEALFSILAPSIESGKVLDLFSGTGNLGIEAISRGASFAYLVEKNRKCFNIIKENVIKTKLNDKIKIIIKDVFMAIREFGEKGENFDIIFMDPPYLKGFIIPCLEEICNNNILKEEGIIAVEHDVKDVLPDRVEALIKVKERKYGKTIISFYSKEA